MPTNQSTKHSRVDTATAIIHGLKLHVTTNLTLNNVSYTESQLEAAFQKAIDASQATAQAKQAYLNAVANERAIAVEFRALCVALLAWVIATFGSTSSVMGDFGFKPRKKSKVKPAVKANAVVKAGATKKARGIMGKKQRKAIVLSSVVSSDTPNHASSDSKTNGSATTSKSQQTPQP